jgi:peptide deformylase
MIIPQTLKLTKKVLHNQATPIAFDNIKLNLTLANRMFTFMMSKDGIGLAAPQIGISKRLFVMYVNGMLYHCFNPEITKSSLELVTFKEGCLSFPDEFINITRPKNIQVRYQDHTGSWIEKSFEGIASVCFQHELDHLNGIVFHDRTTT